MIITILNIITKKQVGKYISENISYRSPFESRTLFIHHFVDEGLYAEGYYLDEESNVLYNAQYLPPVSPPEVVTETKLLNILEYYREESAKFAAANSVMMVMLGYTDEQKAAFVAKAVAELRPIKEEVEMFSFYSIWSMFDAIVRDDILTEERISLMKAGLYAKVFE